VSAFLTSLVLQPLHRALWKTFYVLESKADSPERGSKIRLARVLHLYFILEASEFKLWSTGR